MSNRGRERGGLPPVRDSSDDVSETFGLGTDGTHDRDAERFKRKTLKELEQHLKDHGLWHVVTKGLPAILVLIVGYSVYGDQIVVS